MAHDDVIPQLAEHLRPIFESSPDGVYVWLDETHWTCNENLASMFGYTVDELENSPHLLQRLIHEDDQGVVAYHFVRRVGSR
ncbi:MAG TPA: PAS domain-containing protein [Actinomycetota bacterium]|nr:PAS domain-containing protein [Actinomycetota bacterium]